MLVSVAIPVTPGHEGHLRAGHWTRKSRRIGDSLVGSAGDSVAPGDAPGDRDTTGQRAFHVAHEFVASVFAGEVNVTRASGQHGTHRGDLPGRRKGVAGAGPCFRRPIHKTIGHEMAGEAGKEQTENFGATRAAWGGGNAPPPPPRGPPRKDRRGGGPPPPPIRPSPAD